MTITEKDSVTRLESMAPQVADRIARVRKAFAPDEPPLTCVMGDAGLELMKIADALTDDQIDAIGETVEHLLNEGDDVVQTAVTTGLLEAAANVSSKYPTGARLIRRLGPKALEYVRAWDSFTGAKTPGT